MMPNDFLVKANPLYLHSVVDDFGQLKHVPASLKHINGKYIVCNALSAQRDGIAIEDYIGMTAYDLGKVTHRKQSVTLNAVEADKRLSSREKLSIEYKQALLDHHKSIVIEDVCKRAVLGSKHQVAAILGCAQDITHHAHPMLLFKLYESYLPTQEAIQNFLRYKKLDTLFERAPEREELLTLLTMRDTHEVPAIASQLQCSIVDVKQYQAQLQEKLSILSLEEVIRFLTWKDPEVAKDAIGGLEG